MTIGAVGLMKSLHPTLTPRARYIHPYPSSTLVTEPFHKILIGLKLLTYIYSIAYLL